MTAQSFESPFTSSAPVSPRVYFSECAEGEGCLLVWATEGRPYQRHVGYILLLQDIGVGRVGCHLPLVHGQHAVIACVLRIRRANADVEGMSTGAHRPREHVGGAGRMHTFDRCNETNCLARASSWQLPLIVWLIGKLCVAGTVLD